MDSLGGAEGGLLPAGEAFADGSRDLFSLGEPEMRAIFGVLEAERDAFSTMGIHRALSRAAGPRSMIKHVLVYLAHESLRRGREWTSGARRELVLMGAPEGAVDLFFTLSGGLSGGARAAVDDMFGAMEYSARNLDGRRFGVEVRHGIAGAGSARIVPTVTLRMESTGSAGGYDVRMDADEFEVFVAHLSESLEAAKRGMRDAKARFGDRYVRLVGTGPPPGGGRGAGRAAAPPAGRPDAGIRGGAVPRAEPGDRGAASSLIAAADACLGGAGCRAHRPGPGSWIAGRANGRDARHSGNAKTGDPEAIVGLIRSFGDNSSLVSALEECRKFTRRLPSRDVAA